PRLAALCRHQPIRRAALPGASHWACAGRHGCRTVAGAASAAWGKPMRINRKFAALLFILSGALASAAKTPGASPEHNAALLYAVNQASNLRGAISVYDIAAEHQLIKTIRTVANVGDVRGVAASAATGKLYVAYIDVSGTGMVYCLNLYDDRIVWN